MTERESLAGAQTFEPLYALAKRWVEWGGDGLVACERRDNGRELKQTLDTLSASPASALRERVEKLRDEWLGRALRYEADGNFPFAGMIVRNFARELDDVLAELDKSERAGGKE